MERLPTSLSIASWITGSIWGVAVLAYFIGAPTEWLFPLFALGVLTGIAEWLMARA